MSDRKATMQDLADAAGLTVAVESITDPIRRSEAKRALRKLEADAERWRKLCGFWEHMPRGLRLLRQQGRFVVACWMDAASGATPNEAMDAAIARADAGTPEAAIDAATEREALARE